MPTSGDPRSYPICLFFSILLSHFYLEFVGTLAAYTMLQKTATLGAYLQLSKASAHLFRYKFHTCFPQRYADTINSHLLISWYKFFASSILIHMRRFRTLIKHWFEMVMVIGPPPIFHPCSAHAQTSSSISMRQ